jgi:hypothetical protein
MEDEKMSNQSNFDFDLDGRREAFSPDSICFYNEDNPDSMIGSCDPSLLNEGEKQRLWSWFLKVGVDSMVRRKEELMETV